MQFSRRKLFALKKSRSETVNAPVQITPSKEAVDYLQLMLVKIGGKSQLPTGRTPEERDQKTMIYLSDWWRLLYFENHLVPDDITYDIIITTFTDALVTELKKVYHNQQSITQAFNDWIVREDVRLNLIHKRNQVYGEPKKIAERATQKSYGRPEGLIDNESFQEIQDSIRSYCKVMGEKILTSTHMRKYKDTLYWELEQ